MRKEKYILFPIIWLFFLTPSHADEVMRVGISKIEQVESVGEPSSSEVVSQKLYLELLKEKNKQDIEMQKMKKELSAKDNILTKQKKQIDTILLEIKELQRKYNHDTRAAVGRKQEDFYKKYVKYRENKNNKEVLRATDKRKSLTSGKKSDMEILYDQFQQLLQEEIEKGWVTVEFHRANIR